MAVKVLYPGSFDPVTLGHLDLIERATRLFDAVVVAVGVNPSKEPLFSAEERMAMLEAETSGLAAVEVVSFDGLVVECARKHGCRTLLRGLRTVSDFESEYQMALTNRVLAPDVETVFVMPSEEYSYLSSRLIKEVAGMGGDVGRFVPERVAELLRRRSRKSHG